MLGDKIEKRLLHEMRVGPHVPNVRDHRRIFLGVVIGFKPLGLVVRESQEMVAFWEIISKKCFFVGVPFPGGAVTGVIPRKPGYVPYLMNGRSKREELRYEEKVVGNDRRISQCHELASNGLAQDADTPFMDFIFSERNRRDGFPYENIFWQRYIRIFTGGHYQKDNPPLRIRRGQGKRLIQDDGGQGVGGIEIMQRRHDDESFFISPENIYRFL